MLTYLINVTDEILLVSVIVGAVFAFAGHFLGEKYMVFPGAGLAAGIIAASVRTLVVSWKEAADRKDSVASEALVADGESERGDTESFSPLSYCWRCHI